MTVKDDIRMALHDAIGWQLGLAEAWSEGSPERAEAIEQVRRYRRILKRRYGTADNAFDELLKGAKLVNPLDQAATDRKEPT